MISQEFMQRDFAMFSASMAGDEPYSLGPDSQEQPGVPRGVVTHHRWRSEGIYPGTERDYWLYVPQQLDAAQTACARLIAAFAPERLVRREVRRGG